MKKILVLAALVAAMFTPSIASAQVATADLNWRRVESRGGVTAYTSYDISNGFRNFSKYGTSDLLNTSPTAPADTSAPIPLWNHYYRNNNHGIGTAVTDTVFFGTLIVEGTSAIDSLVVWKQVSSDGVNWKTLDSLSYAGVIAPSGAAIWNTSNAQIYVRGVAQSTGFGGTQFSYTMHTSPRHSTNGAQNRYGTLDVNFVRFYVQMTAADYLAAGQSNGVRARFIYPTR